jgi:hypothetical protein
MYGVGKVIILSGRWEVLCLTLAALQISRTHLRAQKNLARGKAGETVTVTV